MAVRSLVRWSILTAAACRGAVGPAHRRHVGRRPHPDRRRRDTFTLDAPDSGAFEIRVALDGFRGKPVAVAAPATARDLGTIALEISAVSESVVVSAAQVEIPLSTASSSVTVITREDLESTRCESVADALRAVPGLTVVANGGRGALTSVFPRGGESDYSLVFVDGVQANAFGGGYDFAHLPIANIERIEIVRGPQSALYGSNAIGSVDPDRHAAGRRARRVGVDRRRRLRHVPRDGRDVGRGRGVALGRVAPSG